MQSFSNWQQSPVQGTISAKSPINSADEQYLIEVLTECRTKLESALQNAQEYQLLPDLAAGIGDAISGCRDALAVLNDPQTYLE